MFVSLNWLGDFVELPRDLDPHALAERFTRTTAEVDDVHRIEVNARGLICAGVIEVKEIPGGGTRRHVRLDVGGGKTAETVSIAADLAPEKQVVYAPVGASVKAFGQLAQAAVAGKTSQGMILPGEAVGIEKAIQEAIFLSGEFAPGQPLPAEIFDDWIIEIDNKSLTNRPDLWGHYGIAREIAAILGVPLKPYPIAVRDELEQKNLPAIPIAIADARACPRYSAIVLTGVPTQPAPLWMQLRLGHVGQRPISGLVDLSNYIMMELGQPTHAFDAEKVERIEVDWAKEGERFKTLDGVERVMTKSDLMIKRRGESVALAGVMGGLETEVSETTTAMLLESANFDPATVRRTAKRLGLRSEASARFEKSLDPAYTTIAIQRFVDLARAMYPKLAITHRLSDAYPAPREPITVDVKPHHVARTMGREISFQQARELLHPLGFGLNTADGRWRISVPSYRATGDISIEADVIEEIARRVGYDTIAPAMPHVTARQFAINRLHELEQRTLEYFSTAHAFHETHGYLWYDSNWLTTLGYDPGECIELLNPAAEGQHRLRHSLMPGLLAAVAKNRFYFPSLALMELGSVFVPQAEDRGSGVGGQGNAETSERQNVKADNPREGIPAGGGARRDSRSSDTRDTQSTIGPAVLPEQSPIPSLEFRHFALVLAQRGKNIEGELDAKLRAAISGWAWTRFARQVIFREVEADWRRPWEHANRTAEVRIDSVGSGRLSLIDQPLRRRMDEHLVPWAVVWAELWLTQAAAIERRTEKPGLIPPYPVVQLDFSILVPRTVRYAEVTRRLSEFAHPMLRQVSFVASYEGKSIAADKRSLTFRSVIGDASRTLTEEDSEKFRAALEQHLQSAGYELRKG